MKISKSKIITASIIVVGIVIMLYLIFISRGFFYEDDPKLIGNLPLKNRDYNFTFYYIPSNASSQNYFQIRKKYSNNREDVYQNYERYQGYNQSKIVNDSLVSIIVIDTMSYKQRKDTILVKY